MAEIEKARDPAPKSDPAKGPVLKTKLPTLEGTGLVPDQNKEPSLDPKILLDSFNEILTEFAAELKELNEKGVEDNQDILFKQHQEFLKNNFVINYQNIYDLFWPDIQKKNFKGIAQSLKFVALHVIKGKALKEKALPKLLAMAADLKIFAKDFPQLAKAYVTTKDTRVWIGRALREGLAILILLVVIFVAKRAVHPPTPDSFEDIDAEISQPEVVDLKNLKRELKNLYTFPPLIVHLASGESPFRLLQVELVLECDTPMTVVDLKDTFALAEMRSQLAHLFSLYRYEDLDTPEEKIALKEKIIEVIEDEMITGEVYNVYYLRWVFAPLDMSSGRPR